MKFAIVAPVQKPTPAAAGSPRRSSTHPAATSSTAAEAGAGSAKPLICPQAEVSQSAATPAGCEAPITQPWKFGLGHPEEPARGLRRQLLDHRRRRQPPLRHRLGEARQHLARSSAPP